MSGLRCDPPTKTANSNQIIRSMQMFGRASLTKFHMGNSLDVADAATKLALRWTQVGMMVRASPTRGNWRRVVLGASMRWIAPHLPVIEKSQREDGLVSREDFTF
jgi:hypothetical protein